MVQGGLTEAISKDKSTTFSFPDPGTIPPPVIMVQKVSFKYSDDKPLIYKCLEFGIDLDSRIALVGPNGAGKSTLLKLLVGEVSLLVILIITGNFTRNWKNILNSFCVFLSRNLILI